LHPHDRVEELAKSVVKLLKDQNLMEEMGKKGKLDVRNRFNSDKI